MKTVESSIKQRIKKANLDFQESEIRKFILQEFANNGKPPSLRKIMERFKLNSENIANKTVEKLEKFDLLEKVGNEIISSYPFSANATRHKVIFEDKKEVYALCAVDAMGIHFMLNKSITIVSTCPKCENDIKIEVQNGQIISHNPEEIIEFISVGDDCGCTAKSFCPFINFFCSKEHLDEWREENSEYKNGVIYSLTDALEQGKFIFSNHMN